MNFEKVKIVVVGDSGVGKTSLVHLLTHQEVLKKTNWTIGCSVDVKLHEYKDGTPQHKTYILEFFDIGGNSAHRTSAKMFFSGADGIILVHDLTNVKSQENLKFWLSDVLEKNENISVCSTDIGSSFSIDNSNLPPMLFIGTKLDQAQTFRKSNSLRSFSPIALQFRSDEIVLDCMQQTSLAPASSNSIKLAKFFDKVIEYKIFQMNKTLFNEKSNNYTVQTERTRYNSENNNKIGNFFQSKLK